MPVSAYAKAIVAAVGAVVTTLITVLSDDVVSLSEWGVILTAVITAAGVFLKRNEPETVG